MKNPEVFLSPSLLDNHVLVSFSSQSCHLIIIVIPVPWSMSGGSLGNPSRPWGALNSYQWYPGVTLMLRKDSHPQDSRQKENTTSLSSLLQTLEIPCARNWFSYMNPIGWPTRSGQREHLITPSNQIGNPRCLHQDADIQQRSLGYSTAISWNYQSTVNKHLLSAHGQTTVAGKSEKLRRNSKYSSKPWRGKT